VSAAEASVGKAATDPFLYNDCPQVAQVRGCGPSRPLCPSAQRLLEGERGGERRRLGHATRTNLALDDLAFVIRHFLPHLSRDSIGRILPSEASIAGQGCRPTSPPGDGGTFPDHDLGYVRIDINLLRKLQTSNGERHKRTRLVAIDAVPAPCTSRQERRDRPLPSSARSARQGAWPDRHRMP